MLALLVLAGCASTPDSKKYPDHWWQPAVADEKKSWEILPQAADREKNEVILSKRNELGLLSNFAPAPFEYRGKKYASLEGFWQSMKYPEDRKDPRHSKKVKWDMTRDQVAALTAFEAHGAGRKAEAHMKTLGIDWVSFEGQRLRYKTDELDMEKHYNLIYEATKAKVGQNPEIMKVLMSTGDLQLLPDHHQSPDHPKAWAYYAIMMRIRDELKTTP